ncbi:hypothetical protein QJS10_CPB21g01269 [Acorus calamus]|uniref:Clp R domain-containing protein n=1 Tax=Acorus calamus TaxID=4465 RepID=A0AAV9C545_ACOCL|nr:hypothetical protein QJS10_CPB21g01269 [Acorus calamus]
MPTPVSVARQCLAADSARALDDAVSAARRRSHSQTTSLHVVYPLLSSSSSSSTLLRDALSRTPSPSYSPRLHLKALDLCFSVALDRLPSSSSNNSSTTTTDDPSSSSSPPPVSNSLMAAIKRSQANQRRHPDPFHHHHFLLPPPPSPTSSSSSSSSSLSGVRVELQQLVLSILDDPVISRVFSEAGFRSCDIKSGAGGAAGGRIPPIFLCNLTDAAGALEADGNCRRIGEALVGGRGPVLVGVCAADSARDFAGCVGRRRWDLLPPALAGVEFVDVSESVMGDGGGGGDVRIEEAEGLLEGGGGPGVVVCVGDLKGFLHEGEEAAAGAAAEHVVAGVTGMLGRHRGRVWLMGHVASYETYMKFLSRFPSVNKDWDLQLLPITSLRPAAGGLYPRLHSLTESFAPFGGFSAAAPEMNNHLIGTHHSVFRCFLCNEKYEQEAAALLKGCNSIANQNYMSYPSYLQGVEAVGTCNGLDVEKAKEDGAILNAKLLSLQKKWNDICQHLHRNNPMLGADAYRVGVEVSPRIVCLPIVVDKGRTSDQMNNNCNTSPNQIGCGNLYHPSAVDLQKNSSDQDLSLSVDYDSNKGELLSKPQGELSKSEHMQASGKSHSSSLSAASMPDDHTSQCSLASVSTDLVLGTVPAPPLKAEKKQTLESQKERLEFSVCSPSIVSVRCGNTSMALNQSFSKVVYSNPVVANMYSPTWTPPNLKGTSAPVDKQVTGSADMYDKFNSSDFKELCKSLMEKVGRQEEAICAISQTVVRCRTGKERRIGASMKGDVWLSFLGPDRVGKKKIAVALAELIFGSKENFICVDFSLQEGLACSNKIFDRQGMNGYDEKFRGKTVVDHIASEINRKPLSVVFLENVDKADLLVQNSLSQAIRTGKISDSHGREISVNNAMFIATAREIKSKASLPRNECVTFSEERILEAREWQMQILVGSSSEARCSGSNVKVTSVTKPAFLNKRKLNRTYDHKEQCGSLETSKRAHKASNVCLDLNLPVEEMEMNDADFSNDDTDCSSDSSEAWLEEFFDLVDETVVFSPFNFDALANKLLMKISDCFRSAVGSQGMLEIDSKVMDHILAATWLSDDTGASDNWVKQVLVRSFSEAQQRYNISAHTVLKLVHHEDASMEEQALGIHLPARITLN